MLNDYESIFNIGKPLFQWNAGQKLKASSLLVNEDGTKYAHFRYSEAIFPVSDNANAEIVDGSLYLSASEKTELTFTYSSGAWKIGTTTVDLDDYGIEYDEEETPTANEKINITLTDLVSVAVDSNNEVAIPNLLMQFSGQFVVYGYVEGDDSSLTLVQETFKIIARPMPPEYVYIESSEVITYPSLVKLVSDLNSLKAILSVWSATIDSGIGTPSVDVTMSSSGTALAFHNLKGRGITSVAKTSTSGLVDTYTITYNDGTTSTFAVTNGAKGDTGNGISSITKVSTTGLNDTYRVAYTDGTTYDYVVTNGTTFTPSVSSEGVISWTNDGGKTNPESRSIKGTKGDTGATGNGIASVVLNADYTLTITFTDGTSTTTTSIRGAKGETGDTGATGNGISSIAKTGTSGNVDTYTITFTDGTTTTFTVTNGSVTSVNGRTGAVTGLAEQDGYYDTLSVGLADNLIDRKGTGTEQSFTFRTSGGSESLSDDGNGIVQSIHGNTVVWNQLQNITLATLKSSNYNGTWNGNVYTYNGVTFTVNDDLSITINGTATERANFSLGCGLDLIANHKYLDCFTSVVGSASSYINHQIYSSALEVNLNNQVVGRMFTASASTSIAANYNRLQVNQGITISNVKIVPQFIDLTTLFGSGNEPTSVADFKALYPLDYYAYDAGSLLSFNGTGIKTVKFNAYNYSTDLAKVVAYDTSNNGYRISGSYPAVTFCQTSNGTFESLATESYTDGAGNSVTRIKPPSNGYVKISGSDSTTCLNLIWSGYRDTDFEEYSEHTLSWSSRELRSAGTAYDERTKSKDITRIGAVDMGTLNWRTYAPGSGAVYMRTEDGVEGIKPLGNNILCSKYTTADYSGGVSALTDKQIKLGGAGTYQSYLYVYDSAYTDAATFKQAMSGVYLFCELATPTEVAISPELELVYPVSDFGTEQLLPENGSTPTTSPIKAVIKYSEDFTREAVNQPKNYDKKGGIDALCSALAATLSTALNGTFTITRGDYNETTKQYAFTCSFTANS